MIEAQHIEDFIELVTQTDDECIADESSLCSLIPKCDSGFSISEFHRLRQSIHIGYLSGEISEKVDKVASTLLHAMNDEHYDCFTEKTSWSVAITSALKAGAKNQRNTMPSRTIKVAQAYKNLKSQGYDLSINSFGIHWPSNSLEEVSRTVDGLASLLGGSVIFKQISGNFDTNDNIFENIWLFGETSLGIEHDKNPSIPFGWLIALAVKHMHKKPMARKPDIAWRSLVSKATDIAATFDCERYSQFEGIDLQPDQIIHSIRDTLAWHSFFRVNQTHNLTLPAFKNAFRTQITDTSFDKFRTELNVLWNEFEILHRELQPAFCLKLNRVQARKNFPNLFKLSLGKCVNSKFIRPLDREERNDGQYVFLEGEKTDVWVRPLSMSSTAFLETVFRFMWDSLSKNIATKLSGNVLEYAVGDACKGKCPTITIGRNYKANGTDNEFDVACRNKDEILLLEAKGKSLTGLASSGNIHEFLNDISQSFFNTMEQLARHEFNIRTCTTPINANDDVGRELVIEKIVVSPLSFGPVSDKMFQTSLMRTFSRTELVDSTGKFRNKKLVSSFNKGRQRVFSSIKNALDHSEPDTDLHTFFLFSQWLDVSQVLYCLSRVDNAIDAFKPLRHLSFSSRDFWTEIAYAEKQLLTGPYWPPSNT